MRRIAVLTGLLAASVAALPGEARADTAAIAAKRAEVRQVEVELYALDTRAREATAAHQAASARLRDVTARLRRAQQDLQRARRDFGVARERLAKRIVSMYRERRPSTLELLMGSGSITTAVENYTLMKRIGSQDASVVRDVRKLRTRLTALRGRLAVQRREARAAEAETARVRRGLDAAVASRRATLVRAQRALTALIAAEQARAASARLAALRAARARVAARAANPSSGLTAAPVAAAATPVAVSAPSAALAAIAQCESGGNPRAISPGGTYRGKYQFHPDTWRAMGGSGSDPAAAPEAEQDRVAAVLYSRQGAAPWPVCGR